MSSRAGRDTVRTGDMNGVTPLGGSGRGNAAASGSGREKPPPPNDQTRSDTSKVDETSEDEIDDNEETTAPKKIKKSKHSSRKKKKKNKSIAHKRKPTHVNAAEPSNTETSTVRGKALGKYSRTAAKLSTASDRRPYATFNMSAAEASEAPTTVTEFTEASSELPTEDVSEYPSTLPSAQQSSLQVEAPSEVSLLDPPSQSEMTTVDASTLRVSEEEEKVSLLNWDEVLDPWEFSDSEISSNDEQDNWSAANDFEEERNTEWLQVLDRRRGHKRPAEKGNPRPRGRGKALPKEPDFLRVMLPLYRFMTLCGRFPFKIVKSPDGSFKTFVFDKTSKEYRVFFVTSIIFCLCAVLMTFNMVEILLLAPPLSDYNQVIALEFDKYWLEGVMGMLWLYFITFSSASMLMGGRGVAEMLNRWVESLELIGYNGTWGLRSRLTLVYLGVILVFVLFVVGFVMDVGHVRGSWGFEGLLILHYFERGLRLDLAAYRAAEILGLVVDLFVTLAATFTLTLIGVHAWTLDNAARRFNLRLGLTLRSLTFKTPDDVPLAYRKLVPYRKLFAEFLVISSFPKVIGAAFFFTINAFFAFLMVGMVVTLYGMYTAVILDKTTLNADSTDNPNEYNVTGLAEPGQFIPVQINKPPESRFCNEAWLAASVWGIGIVFLEILQLPGATIMEGSRFVLRRGFVNCRSVFERRFVASMIISYSPPALSCIRPGYSINRRFIGKFIGFTFSVFMIFIQFNPYRLQTESFLYCESLEQCVVITASKVAQNWPEVQKAVERIKEKPKPADSDDDDSGNGDAPLFPLPKIPEILPFPTCASNGMRLVEPSDFTTDCGHARVPNLFTKTVNGTFSRVPVPCNNTIPPQNASGGDLFDCFGGKVDLGMTDECGNLFLSTPNSSGETQKPIVRVAVINYGSVFCCFTYPHEDLKDQGNDCNIPRSDRGNRYNLCKEKNLTNPAGVKMSSTTPYFAPTATTTATAVSTTTAGPRPTGTTQKNPTSSAVAVDLMKSWRKQFLEERAKNPDQLRDNETLKVQWAECLCHGIPGIQASMNSCDGLNTTEPATPQTTTVNIPPTTPTTASTSNSPTSPTTASTSSPPTITTATSGSLPITLRDWPVFNEPLWDSQSSPSEKGIKLEMAKLFVECDVKDPNSGISSKAFRLGVFEKERLTNNLTVRYLNDPKKPDECEPVVGRQDQLKTNGTLYNSYWERVDPAEFLDDCGNLKLAFPDHATGDETEPTLTFAELNQGQSKFSYVFMCCWDYKHLYHPNANYPGECNLPKNSDFTNICAVRGADDRTQMITVCSNVFSTLRRNLRYQEACYDNGVTKCHNDQVLS